MRQSDRRSIASRWNGKAAAAIAAARSAAAKSVGLTTNGNYLEEVDKESNILRFDGVPPLLLNRVLSVVTLQGSASNRN